MFRIARIISYFVLLGIVATSCAQYPLQSADNFLNQGSYGRAILRYRDYIAEHPNGAYAEDALFRTGLAYKELEHALGAQQELRRYLMYYPDGKYANEARSILAEMQRSNILLAQSGKKTRQEIWNEIQKLEAALEEGSVDEAKAHFNLGGKYWELGDYEKSFQHDVQAYKLNKDYAFDSLFRKRVNFTADGEIFSLAPERKGAREEIIQVRNDRKNVVLVEGLRRGDRTFKEYIVSGEVVNRGTVMVRNVSLEITLLRLGNTVISSRIHRIGNMLPGEVRTFSTSFSEFDVDDPYAVFDYKIKPIYNMPNRR